MNLRQRLRTETSDPHQDLENTLDLLSPTLTRPRYRGILEVFLRLQEGLEAWLEHNPQLEPARFYLADRRKVEWIRSDVGTRETTDGPIDFSWANTEAKLWGVLYVIEGSTLGGQVLGPRLERFQSEGLGTQYFKSYGPAVGLKWQAFVKELDKLPATAADDVVEAARTTFSMLANEFKRLR